MQNHSFLKTTKKRISGLPLRLKILGGFIATLLLITFFIINYYPRVEKKHLKQNLEEKYKSTAQMIAFGVGAGISLDNDELIQESLDLAEQDTDLVLIVVLDRNREVNGIYNPLNITDLNPYLKSENTIIEQQNKPFYTVEVPIVYNGNNYGIIHLVSSLESHYQSIRANTILSMLISLHILFIGVIISYLFIRSATRSLFLLQKATEKIKNGNYENLVDIKSNDEIGKLAKSFNEMSSTIHELFVKLNKEVGASKKAENNLRIRETQIRTLLQSIPDLIWLKDKEGRYLSCNFMFEQANGLKEKDIIGKTDADIINIEDAEYFKTMDKKVLDKQKTIQFEHWSVFKKTGKRILLDTTKTPMYNSKGLLIGVLGIAHDITKRKQTETEIKLKNEELIKINAEKDRFFSIIAHDLRGPFNSFLGLTQMMDSELDTLSKEELQKMTSGLKSSASRLFGLLENLLKWARAQQGLIPFSPKNIELLPLVEECIGTVSESLRTKKIDIKNTIQKNLFVYADNNMLETIIRNLLSNAVKFTPKEGKIKIAANACADSKIELTIQDTGIRMNAKMLNNLFRLDVQTNRKGTEGEPSSGLGLLLSKEFVEKNGGTIWAESIEGEGTTFFFTIPSLSSKNTSLL